MSEAEEECAKPAPFRGSAPFLLTAPPFWVPMRHFTFAAFAYLLFAAALTFGAGRLVGFGFEARFALGLVHVLTLGWTAQHIFGAWTQMLSVHGETPLSSVAGFKRAWWLFSAGNVGFVATLWSGSDRYWIPAAALAAGVGGYWALFGLMFARSKRRDWTGTHFLAAFLWLAGLATVGLLMAIDRQRGLLFKDPEGGLIAHVHMALVGFVGTTILGAGYRLFPWVAMHQTRSRLEGRIAFWLLQAGLAGLAADGLFFGRRHMPLWAAALAAAYAVYLLQFRPLLSAKPSPEPNLALLLLGLAGGLLWAGLGVGLALGRFPEVSAARAAYVYAALVGCVTPIILSQIHKIAPFLVWLHVYSPREWTPPVSPPKIDDLTSRSLAWAEFGFLAAAIPLGVLGLLRESEGLLRTGGAALLGSALAYAANAALTLRHAFRSDPRWDAPGDPQRRAGS